MTGTAYNIVLSEKTLQSLVQYKADITTGKATPGDRLKEKLAQNPFSDISTEKFLEALLATKPPRLFAESEIRGDGSDWNHRELALLGDINVTMAAKIFDNGVWSPSSPDFKQYTTPLDGNLLFTPGALLNTGAGFRGKSPDYTEVTTSGKIDQQKYNALIERRMLPLFAEASENAKQAGKPAFVTLPGIGCGAFAGKFRGEMAGHLNTALQTLLEKHGDKLGGIKGVYFDSFNECGNEQRDIQGIQYRVRPAMQNPGKPQLAPPETYQETGDDFSNCTLYKIVAWDHASLPGNDFFANDRATDDGVSAAATNSMEAVTGIKGQYAAGKYLPPQGYATWEDVALKNGVHLAANGNVKIVTADAAILSLNAYEAKMEPSPQNQEPDMNVTLTQGDITRTAADAIIVPQFGIESSKYGVGAALNRAGFGAGMQDYQDEILRTRKARPDGSALLTLSGRADIPYLLHATVINDACPQDTFERVKAGVYNALLEAEKQTDISRITSPALGTSNGLTPEQSAEAMLGALYQYEQENRRKLELNVVIYNDLATQNTFQQVLDSGSYKPHDPYDPSGLGERMSLYGTTDQGIIDAVKRAIVASSTNTTPPQAGIKDLSPDVRGFLYTFFNQAAMMFPEASKQIEPGLVEAVTPPADSLAFAFKQAAAAARSGNLQDVNDAITNLVRKANAATNPAELDNLDTVRLQQQLLFKTQVKNNQQLKAALGGYGAGIV